MTKKFAIVLALFVISIVCCAGCIGPGEEPVDPVVPVDPVDPVTPVDPVDPVVPVEEYSVMFMLNYGDAGAHSAETVKAGETVSKPAAPTRSGYTFTGWFTAAEGGAEYDFTQAVNADVTLYAQWKKVSSSSGGSSHSHNWGTGSVTTLATCGAEGVLTYTCSCGQTKTATIPATGQHALTTDGSTVRCPLCGFSYNLPAVSTDNVVLVGGQASTYDSIEDAIQEAADEGIAEITVLSTSDSSSSSGSSGSSPVEVNVPEGATEVTINCQDNDVKLTYPENTDLNDIKIKADDSAEVKVKIGDTTAVILDKESTDADADYTRNDDGELKPAAVVDSSDSTGEAFTAYGLQFLFSGDFTSALAAPVEAAPAEHIQDGWTVLFYEPAPTALGDEATKASTWTITLGNDIVLQNTLTVSDSFILNLNSKTLTAVESFADTALIKVIETGVLEIIGPGTVNSASQGNDYSIAVWAAGGEVTINGGIYTNDGAKDVEDNGVRPNNNEMIYASNGGHITIKDGFFKGNTQNARWGTKYTLNIKDNSDSVISVNGGTFVEYNPAASASESPIANFVAEGYVAYLDEQTDGSQNWIVMTQGEAIPVDTANELTAAIGAGYDVILTSDVAVPADTTFIVTSGQDITLNLGGYTLSSTNTRTNTHNFFIDVKGGTLTVKNGEITYTHTGSNMEWGGATTIFDVTAGGVLNMEGVTAKNLGGTDMNFVVHLNNWGEVTLNADNCVVDSTYCGVRVFNSGYDQNNVKITNSELTGNNRAFWVHNYIGDLDSSKHSDTAIINRLKIDIFNPDNKNKFTLKSTATSPIRYGFGSTVYFDENGRELVTSLDGLKSKLDAATGETTIALGADITVTETLVIADNKIIILDLNGHNIYSEVSNDGKAASIITITPKGTLTIIGEGKLSFKAADPDLQTIPGYATNTITCEGTLTIGEGVTVENHSEGGASYAVDAKGVFTLDGGTLIGDRCALRIAKYNQDNVQFTMNSGLVKAKTPAWIQLSGSDANVAPSITVTINGGTFQSTKDSAVNNDVLYTYSFGNSHANTQIAINGGNFLGGTVSIGFGYYGDIPSLTITGGTFEYDVLQWLAEDESTVLYQQNLNQ